MANISNNQAGFPGPPSGANSSPGGTPGLRPPSTGPSTPQMPTPQPVQLASPTKDFNIALCRIGQESVQDIVNKTLEIFQMLKATQLPNGANHTIQMFQERKLKLEDQVRQMMMAMKKLRIIYDKVQENTSKLESRPIEELLPIEEGGEVKGEKPKLTDGMEMATDEHHKLVEQVCLKNRQLKEIIDQFRTIVWEINTMMAMKKS